MFFMFCKYCGKEIATDARFCPSCGATTQETPQPVINIINTAPTAPAAPAAPVAVTGDSPKNKWVAFFLCFLLGYLGAHRFYVGKVGTGILWLFTCGMGSIGWLIDLIVILCGNFTDKQGRKLV